MYPFNWLFASYIDYSLLADVSYLITIGILQLVITFWTYFVLDSSNLNLRHYIQFLFPLSHSGNNSFLKFRMGSWISNTGHTQGWRGMINFKPLNLPPQIS